MFTAIDNFTLKYFQKFSEWSQVTLDKNCYWWAYMLTHVSGVVCLIIAGLILAGILDFHTGQAILYLMIVVMEYRLLPSKYRKISRNMPFPEPLPQIRFFARILFLHITILLMCIFPPDVMDIPPLVWGVMYYFESCIPLPPSETRRRQALKAGFQTQAT